jgi:hypothetical protein
MKLLARRRRGRAAHGKGGGGTGKGGRRKSPAGGVLSAIGTIIGAILSLIALLIIIYIVFVVFEANGDNAVVSFFADAAKFFVGPLDGLFTPERRKLEVGINYGIAAALYLIVGRIVASVLSRIG